MQAADTPEVEQAIQDALADESATEPSKSSKASSTTTSAPAPEKKKAAKRKSEAMAPDEPPVQALLPVNDDNTPLTMEEQELLTETINELPPEHLYAVAQIIREAAPVGANDDEIDVEIDELDISTQRKLWRHVSKFIKKSKANRMKKAKITNAQPKKTKATSTAKAQPAEEVHFLRIEEEAKEAELKKQEEEEAEKARQEARKAARAQVESVGQTVDYDARDRIDIRILGDSPSSDFGF